MLISEQIIGIKTKKRSLNFPNYHFYTTYKFINMENTSKIGKLYSWFLKTYLFFNRDLNLPIKVLFNFISS